MSVTSSAKAGITSEVVQRSGFALVATAAVLAIVIAGKTLPVAWTANEINYFDLAYRFVTPEAFGPDHSVFDSSQSRAVSFFVLGSSISVLGFEMTKTLFGGLLCALSALGLALVAQGMRLSTTGAALALMLFLALGQSFLGGEWIFRSVEAKVFAYAAVFFAIGLSLARRWAGAIILLVVATYLHFLVGLFWAAAVLGLMLLTTRHLKDALRYGALFSLLVTPIFVILLNERVGVTVDLTGLDRSLAEIYAEYRNPHHVAPFYPRPSTFILFWLPGVIGHGLLAVLLWRLPTEGAVPVGRWLAALNVYIPLAIVLAFLDREAHSLAPFYMLRPSGLILLLSLMMLAQYALKSLDLSRIATLALLGMVLAFTLPPLALKTRDLLTDVGQNRLVLAQNPAQLELIEWIMNNTAPETPILLEPPAYPGSKDEGLPPLGGFERLTGRPFVVNYKFVPVDNADLVTWYRRVTAREAYFAGDCAAMDQLGADVVIFRKIDSLEPLGACVTPLETVGNYIITKPAPTRH